MSRQKLTKAEALQLITSVIDEETDEQERLAFFDFMDGNEEVRKKYESEKRIKALIRDRCPYYKAPDSLKRRVQQFLEHRGATENPEEEHLCDIPSSVSPADQNIVTQRPSFFSNKKWLLIAAGILLLAVAFAGIFFQYGSPSYSIEEYVYRHFSNHNGQLMTPFSIKTASLTDAEKRFYDKYKMRIKVPSLQHTKFRGITFAEFVPGFKTPLLQYYLTKDDQYIYIFAFSIDSLIEFGRLLRNEEAVQRCIGPRDFHILKIHNMHVVSWKWNRTWYSAISNRDGEELASMIKSLEFNPGNKGATAKK